MIVKKTILKNQLKRITIYTTIMMKSEPNSDDSVTSPIIPENDIRDTNLCFRTICVLVATFIILFLGTFLLVHFILKPI